MESTFDKIISGGFDFLKAKVEADNQEKVWSATANNPNIAVDELGRPYLRGAPTLAILESPVVLVGGALLLGTLIFLAVKR